MGFPLLSGEEQACLVRGIRDGDTEAEGRLVQLFSAAVRVMARVRARGVLDEEDLAQEVLMAALRAVRRGQLRDSDRLGAFVSGIARNVINNRLRADRSRRFEPLSGHEDKAVADLRQEVAERERLATVGHALAELSADDRQVLVLTLMDGLKPSEIARRLGLGEEVVRTRKSRALRRLKEKLSG